MSSDISEMSADISFSSPHRYDIPTRICNGVLENVGRHFGKIRYVGRHFPEMSADIWGKFNMLIGLESWSN